MAEDALLVPHNSVGVEQSGKVAKVDEWNKWTRSANFHTTINIIKPKKHYFCEVTMNAMKNDCLTPNFKPQTYYAGFHLSFVIRNFSFVISSQRTAGWDAMFTFSGKERDQETGYSYFGARYYDSDLSIWLSVDPMASKYPSLSPYNYCMNNPIKLVDPDGREVVIGGDQAQEAFNSLQQGTNLKLKMGADGKVNATGDALNDNDQKLLDAINSTSVTVNIDASSGGYIDGEYVDYTAGHYAGTIYNQGDNTASSTNAVNITGLTALENPGAAGSGMMHEVTEGYQMGLIAIGNKASIKAAVKNEVTSELYNPRTNVVTTFTDYVPKYPADYKLFETGHSRATCAPNEMTKKQSSGYKFPQSQYVTPLIQKFYKNY